MGDLAPRYVAVTFSPQPSVAYFLKGVLDCAGFTATAISSRPDDLVGFAQRARADVIVYDVNQPGAEARKRLARLRRLRLLRDVPIVVVTSDPQAVDRAVGARTAIALAGRVEDVKRLREAVRSAVTRRHDRPAA